MKTHIWLIVDKSGSMGEVTTDVIGGINAYVKDRESDDAADTGDALLSLTFFDTVVTSVYKNQPPAAATPLTAQNYVPQGFTALLDAVGSTLIVSEGDVNPGDRVLVVIFTDGQENSSKEFSAAQIKRMIEERSQRGNYSFVFMGADQDSWISAAGYGMQRGNTVNFSKKQTGEAIKSLSGMTRAYRASPAASVADLYAGRKDAQDNLIADEDASEGPPTDK